MSTNQNIITKAFEKAAIVADGQAPTANDSTNTLTKLNQMLSEWALKDMDLHFPPQDTLGATCPIPLWAEAPIIASLAERICPDYTVQVTNDLAREADEGRRFVANTLINSNLEKVDMSHMAQGNYRYPWDVINDV